MTARFDSLELNHFRIIRLFPFDLTSATDQSLNRS